VSQPPPGEITRRVDDDRVGMTQVEAARAMGIAHQTLQAIEKPALRKLRRLAKRDPAWREAVAHLLGGTA
jgi:DNA-binding XRE family transcriptional regulator